MTKKHHVRQMKMALASVMRLLVLLRETLIALGVKDSALFNSVDTHAKMCGSLIDNENRMTPAELLKLRQQIGETATESFGVPAPLIDRGRMVVLQRRADGKLGEGPGLPGLTGIPIQKQIEGRGIL